jgi:DNA-binding GntR family transcriptional regulator
VAGQTDSVIDLIIARIDAGDMLPGNEINEKEMMEACGVSRTPVREALIRLETDGLVQRHPRKGAVIFRPTVAEFLTILEVHANLESFAAGLAAQRITTPLEAEFRKLLPAIETGAHQAADVPHTRRRKAGCV